MPRRQRNKTKSHHKIVKRRNGKKQKENSPSKEYHLKEFLKLSLGDDITKKDVAMKVMNIVEEVKDEGLNDKRYMDIMNLLMKIHKSEDSVNEDTWSQAAVARRAAKKKIANRKKKEKKKRKEAEKKAAAAVAAAGEAQ
jgi:hypothetical protein